MNKKELILQIQKMAQDSFPKPPSGLGTKPVVYVPGKNIAVMGGIPEVKEMQAAVQELAQEVMRDQSQITISQKPKDKTSLMPSDPSYRKAFNDFIAEQYIGTLDESKKGVEWKDAPGSKVQKKKDQTDVYELDAVMNTLFRIGTVKDELTADGKWGFRTDNALRNIMGFAYALLQIDYHFELPKQNIYTIAQWGEFQKLLSGYKIMENKDMVTLSPTEQSNRAKQITKHLKSIIKLYNYFRLGVFEKPEYRKYIENIVAFDKYEKGYASLNPVEENLAKTNTPIKFEPAVYYSPIDQEKKTINEIPLNALLSEDNFKAWAQKLGFTDNKNVIRLFNIIKPKIQALQG